MIPAKAWAAPSEMAEVAAVAMPAVVEGVPVSQVRQAAVTGAVLPAVTQELHSSVHQGAGSLRKSGA